MKYALFSPLLSKRTKEGVKSYLPVVENGFEPFLIRNQDQYQQRFCEPKTQDEYRKLQDNYDVEVIHVADLETINLKRKIATGEWEIFFAGSDQDATSAQSMVFRTANLSGHAPFATENRNIVLWNYPGVGVNASSSLLLAEAGIAQVEYLLNQGVAVDKITLHGKSLGGAVALEVAIHFFKQHLYPNIEIDRTFSTFSDEMTSLLTEYLAQKNAVPAADKIIFLAALGAVPGLKALSITPQSSLFFINKMVEGLAGIVSGIGMLSSLAIVGPVALLSDKAGITSMKLNFAIRAMLKSADAEMNNIKNLEKILEYLQKDNPKSRPRIDIINTRDDEIINYQEASLYQRICQSQKCRLSSEFFTSTLYDKGGHIYEVGMDEETGYGFLAQNII